MGKSDKLQIDNLDSKGHFIFSTKLGEGGFGGVYAAIDVETGD